MNITEKDEYGLYVHAPNYHDCRSRMDGYHRFQEREKLNRIPKCIRKIFNAV